MPKHEVIQRLSSITTWQIKVQADSPLEAAREALRMRGPISSATVFDVFDENGVHTRVDLDAEEEGI
jgi:hypothetical protein